MSLQKNIYANHFIKKKKKEDGFIDLNGDPTENFNKYRAFEGWPSVYFFTQKHGKDTRVKITKASYKEGQFIIEKVIPEGKKEMTYLQFLS
jgi:methionyl-tRNA formyltransferase